MTAAPIMVIRKAIQTARRPWRSGSWAGLGAGSVTDRSFRGVGQSGPRGPGPGNVDLPRGLSAGGEAQIEDGFGLPATGAQAEEGDRVSLHAGRLDGDRPRPASHPGDDVIP